MDFSSSLPYEDVILEAEWASIWEPGVGGQPADGRCRHAAWLVHCDDPKIKLGTSNYTLCTLKINRHVITELVLQTTEWSFFLLGDECKVYINLEN